MARYTGANFNNTKISDLQTKRKFNCKTWSTLLTKKTYTICNSIRREAKNSFQLRFKRKTINELY